MMKSIENTINEINLNIIMATNNIFAAIFFAYIYIATTIKL